MVMTAAVAQDAPLPAEVVYTHIGSATAWRLGDECYVSPESFKDWGWTYTFVQNEATIQAEGRTLKVTAKAIKNRMLIPLRPAIEQLGAAGSWRSDIDTFDVCGLVRGVTVREGRISLDSTLALKPSISTKDNPPRLVLDFKGARLDPHSKQDLEANARIAQFSGDTVRITIFTDGSSKTPASDQATRHFEMSYAAIVQKPAAKVEVKEEPKTVVQEVPKTTAQGTGTGTTIPPSTAVVIDPPPVQPIIMDVGPFELLSDTPKAAIFSLKLTRALSGAIQVKRVDPITLQLGLPGLRYVTGPLAAGGPVTDISSVQDQTGSTVTIKLSRPMGLEISNNTTELELILSKPAIGNGKLAGKTIVVDPGHGDHDSGAKSPDKSVLEKDLNLAIGKKVAEYLAAEGATVIMTRKTDIFITLKERPAIANRNNADFFLSVHINSNGTDEKTSGSITFFHGQDPTSKLLAECIEHEIGRASAIPPIGVWSDTKIYKSTGFAVLHYSRMPAVLIETGFINNSHDRAIMVQPEFQDRFARAIVRGVRVYLGDAKPEN